MGGAGVQRALKFVRYLADFGVQSVVLAGDDAGYLQDPSLLAELPAGLRVLRVPHRTALARLLALRTATTPSSAQGPAAAGRPGVSAATRDILLDTWAALHWPDDRGGWARRAYAAARRLVDEEGIEMVLSTSPPVAAHALARRLARAAGLPWVSDWRDLWTDNPGYSSPSWRRAADERLERRWLTDADGVVTVTPSWQRLLQSRVLPPRQVAFIPNGYDESDFEAPCPVPPPDGQWRLVHVGTLYGHQTPVPLLAAVDQLLARYPETRGRVVIRLVGACGSRFVPALAAFEARWPRAIEVIGVVDHASAVAEMRQADVLLLLVGGGRAARGVLPGKLFEYLRAGKPMLVVGEPGGDAASLAVSYGDARVAAESDAPGIAASIWDLFSRTSGAVANPQLSRISRFERRALAGELAAFLRACRGPVPARHG